MFTFIDVARYQTGIDLAAAGVDGVFIKASGANDGLYVAGGYDDHLDQGRRVFGNVGHYFFNGPTGTPTQAADFFLDNLDWRDGDGAALDVEPEAKSDGSSMPAYTPDDAFEFAARVKTRRAVAPLIYASVWMLNSLDWSKCISLGCRPWPAWWGDNDGTPGEPPVLSKQWGDWPVWQYTSNGTVPGWEGRVDLNLSKVAMGDIHPKGTDMSILIKGGDESRPWLLLDGGYGRVVADGHVNLIRGTVSKVVETNNAGYDIIKANYLQGEVVVNLSSVNAKIADLTTQVADLTAKVAELSPDSVIDRLHERTAPKG